MNIFRFSKFLTASVLSLLVNSAIADNPQKVYEADIIVYGGTSAAATAAIQAKLEGKSVIVVSPDMQLGAMTSSGLGFTDSGKASTIGGLSREFYHRVWKAYQDPNAWNWQPREQWKGSGQGTKAINDKTKTMWVFEPKVAEKIYNCWLAEKGVVVHRGERLLRDGSGVDKSDGKIVSIKTLSGKVYCGKMFIDCTFEGDLMAEAGCDYHVGREANSVYGEDYNGFRATNKHNYHFFKSNVDPYKVEGDPSSGLLKYISDERPLRNGEGDKKVQAYCFRMCLTDNPDNMIPIQKPENYNPSDYDLCERYYRAEKYPAQMIVSSMPNKKTDCNNKNAFSTDFIGMNYAYPEASYQEREKIIEAHKNYQLGFLYFLQNDERLPNWLRSKWRKFGLAKDEFEATGGWPFNLYIREARRMVGEYVMTQADCQRKRATPDSVGMGSYTLDSHNTSRYVTKEGFVQNEGDVEVGLKKPYMIAYGSIVPKKKDCKNLLVPVACSASHIAYGSIRMEPVFMILGQSAATAASIAIDSDSCVQDVDYKKLSRKLVADGQILSDSHRK